MGRINFETTVMVMGWARLLGEMSAETMVGKVRQLVGAAVQAEFQQGIYEASLNFHS